MKKLLLWLLLVAPIVALAGKLTLQNGSLEYRSALLEAPDVTPWDVLEVGQASKHPLRRIGSNTVDLLPTFHLFQIDGLAKMRNRHTFTPLPKPLAVLPPGWRLLHGKVVQLVDSEGYLMQPVNEEMVFLRTSKEDPELLSGLVDGAEVHVVARVNATYKYTDVQGAARTIPEFYYGEIVKGAEAEAYFARYQQQLAIDAQAEKAAAEAKVAKAKAKQEQLDAAVAKFKAEQAAKKD